MASHLRLTSVAVIGAGISGVVAAAHLKRQGLTVTVFERNYDSGGVWLFDERLPPEPVYPSTKPSLAEITQDGDEQSHSLYAPPGPAYSSLMNNVSTGLLQTSLLPWPEGTPPIVSHTILKKYIQSISKTTGVYEITRYNTRVVDLRKLDNKWHITSDVLDWKSQVVRDESTFDAVVVASGHYHAPRIPDKPGLKEWKANWPDRVFHSKAYRYPDKFERKNVIILGAGVSSLDIAKDISSVANKIWQTTRGGDYDLPGSLLPENAVQVPDAESFQLPHVGKSDVLLEEDEPIPLTVTLTNGRKICDIHYVIIATGYHITLPFLSYLHQDDVEPEKIDEKTIVSDGTMFHNLHKDIFYIPDPTLSFIGVPYYTATFSLFEFQARLLALVYGGHVGVPPTQELRDEYSRRVKDKGLGRAFNSLRDKEEEYVAELAKWANPYLAERGEPLFEGHSDLWKEQKAEQRVRIAKILKGSPFDPAITEAALAAVICS